jgi:acyl-CoA reductase-like NAD-dependent aldehyde dehydrogenase
MATPSESASARMAYFETSHDSADEAPAVETVRAVVQRVRANTPELSSPASNAATLARVCELWRDRRFGERRNAIGQIAASWGFSEALLDESLDALLAPFTLMAFEKLAATVRVRPSLIGFILPGNVPGAGLHEVAIALTAGAGVVVKAASAEPVFFKRFARTFAAIDPDMAGRVEVMSWGREREDLHDVLASSCDMVVGFGDDGTIAELAARHGSGRRSSPDQRENGRLPLIGFGSRTSGVLVTREAATSANRAASAAAVARDVTLFEQRGCLSPHYIFVEDPLGWANSREFAAALAGALARLAERLPSPRRYQLEDAIALRRAREAARWRALGGQPVELWEGDGLSWTVILDHCDEAMRSSPGYRTAWVFPVADVDALMNRIEPLAERLEAFAIAGPATGCDVTRARLEKLGVSYVCEAGQMQSPPLEWRHGGGGFIEIFREGR